MAMDSSHATRCSLYSCFRSLGLSSLPSRNYKLTFGIRMHIVSDSTETPAPLSYNEIVAQAAALVEGEHDFVANTANLTALIYHALADVNWVGFYFVKGGELVLGPFQGRPACIRIRLGEGVCGTAAAERRTINYEVTTALRERLPRIHIGA